MSNSTCPNQRAINRARGTFRAQKVKSLLFVSALRATNTEDGNACQHSLQCCPHKDPFPPHNTRLVSLLEARCCQEELGTGQSDCCLCRCQCALVAKTPQSRAATRRWTNRSSPPSFGAMKPKPFSSRMKDLLLCFIKTGGPNVESSVLRHDNGKTLWRNDGSGSPSSENYGPHSTSSRLLAASCLTGLLEAP